MSCDYPLPTTSESITYFGDSAGYIYLISASDCNDFYLANTDSYADLLAEKESADNPFDVEIPLDYESMYTAFQIYTDGYMLVTGLQWLAEDVIED